MKKKQARLFYALMLGAAIGLALFPGGKIPYGSAAVLVLVLPAAFLLAWAPGRQLTVRHAFDRDDCERGSEARYALAVRNRGIVPASRARVKVVPSRDLLSGPDVFEMSLEPFGQFRWEESCVPAHRGVYSMSLEDMAVTDPFSLVTLKLRRAARELPPVALTVLPKLVPIPEGWKARLDPQGMGGVFAQSTDEPAVDSRQYRYGDSRRRIHWKLTARQRELMVRQYESIESRRLLVVLDLSPFEAEERESCEDVLIEYCLSLVQYALERRIETILIYGQDDAVFRFSGRDLRFFDGLRRDMAAAVFNSRVTLPELLSEAAGAQMIYLFGAEVPAVLDQLPQDKPVELAVIKGFSGDGAEGRGAAPSQMMRVTVLEP